MTGSKQPERGRFVAQGDKIILLYDDGRIESATKGADDGAASPPPLIGYSIEATEGVADPEKPPFVDPEAVPGRIEGWEDWPQRTDRTYNIEVFSGSADDPTLLRLVKAAGRRWDRVTPVADQPGLMYTWIGLSDKDAKALAEAAGMPWPDED